MPAQLDRMRGNNTLLFAFLHIPIPKIQFKYDGAEHKHEISRIK